MAIDVMSKQKTLFHEEWLLDAATLGAWELVELEQDGKKVIQLPFLRTSHLFCTHITMPPYVNVLGPLFNLPESKPVTAFANACKAVAEISAMLPRHGLFLQCLPPECEFAQAFRFCGYEVIEDYTFRIAPSVCESTVLANMHWRSRSHITKTLDRIEIRYDADFDRFVDVAVKQAVAGSKKLVRDFVVSRRIFDAAVKRGCGVSLAAYEAGEVTGTALLLFDDKVAYFWQGARLVREGNQAYTRLIWEAYRFAKQRGLIFDFDGFSNPQLGAFLASFGAEMVARRWVRKVEAPTEAILAAVNLARAARDWFADKHRVDVVRTRRNNRNKIVKVSRNIAQ
jgi:hypothetical protein